MSAARHWMVTLAEEPLGSTAWYHYGKRQKSFESTVGLKSGLLASHSETWRNGRRQAYLPKTHHILWCLNGRADQGIGTGTVVVIAVVVLVVVLLLVVLVVVAS